MKAECEVEIFDQKEYLIKLRIKDTKKYSEKNENDVQKLIFTELLFQKAKEEVLK